MGDGDYYLPQDVDDWRRPERRIFVIFYQQKDTLKKKKFMIFFYYYNKTLPKIISLLKQNLHTRPMFDYFNKSNNKHTVYTVYPTPYLIKKANLIEPKRPLDDGYPDMPNGNYTWEGIACSVP